ncbi:MAG: MMPL family transporter [Spiribacter salinus]|uniref:MMPL family transporter n=1 Tax=Spiribacter salinus TaxID=1335746 RepID=A0A540VV46_9GAMM|nr:MAG: MMPL family transporter [Spiribacter salinus]
MVERFARFCIRCRTQLVVVFGLLTLVLGVFAAQIEVRTIFSDMLPQNHRWVQTHEQYKELFGGANVVSIMVRNEDGEIFDRDVLGMVREITRDLRKVQGVNQFQIVSLASKKLKTVEATSTSVDTVPLMWPDIPENAAGIAELREKVLQNPLVYGQYVSPDLESALITVDFIDRLVEPAVIFDQVHEIVERHSVPGVETRIVGEPILNGWVRNYLSQTALISLVTIGMLMVTLLLLARTWRGTLLPLVSGTVSGIWALGVASLLGLNFDPLIIVVAFLITARSISHSVQMITRYDDIADEHPDMPLRDVARKSLAELFRPAVLGIVSDAGAIAVVWLTPIPLLQKVAIIGVIWVSAMLLSAVVLTPVLLSWLRRNKGGAAHPVDLYPAMHRLLEACAYVAIGPRSRYVLIAVGGLVLVGSSIYAVKNLQVGDAQPGSPILWPDSEYNLSAADINANFPGADRMFLVFEGASEDAMKEPEVLRTMREFQRFMEAQPQVGGSVSLADVVSSVNQSLHEGNPRYYDISDTAIANGQYLYMYVTGSDPGDLAQYSDPSYTNGAVTFYFSDRTGETIRTAFARTDEFMAEHPMEQADYRLAGGLIGILGAVNDVILKGQIRSIALALLVVVIFATAAYRSSVAGMFFMVPVLLSNTVTFAYMAFSGIGFNINTLPVVALGIGLGVDYSLYVVNGIRDEYQSHGNAERAVVNALRSAGRGVFVTGVTMVMGVFFWILSSLRFQAEMGLLIALWLAVSAISALLLMPALAYVARPRFVFGQPEDAPASEAASVPVRN